MSSRSACCCAMGLVAACLAFRIEAANKPSASASDEVQTFLQSEIQTANRSIDRRTSLHPGVRPESDSPAAFWHSGYVQSGKQWLRFEETIAEGADARRLNDYMEHRDAYLKRPHGQAELANWCRKNGLFDQERVHLLQALAAQDSTIKLDVAYQRLGCQKDGGVWVSPYERREAAELAAGIEASYKRWNSKLQAIKESLNGSQKQRAIAEKQMAEITNGSAVPALVYAFCMGDQSLAELGVKTLGQIPGYQASRALAGQAVFSSWRPVRLSAIELLKSRKLEEFAPDLLLLLANPLRTKSSIAGRREFRDELFFPNVRMNWDYAWVEESPNTIRVGIRRLFPISVPALMIWTPDRRDQNPRDPSARNLYLSIAICELSDQAMLLDYHADKMNDFRTDMNERVIAVLSKCTNESKSTDPNFWWKWYATFSNMDSPSQKPIVVVDERKDQPNVSSLASVTYTHHSCLVAGTAVWTERGWQPIETICPGDLVLAKDVASGELRYKPVLQSTVREPTPVQQFCVGDDTIVASPGHHFWVSGDGWTKVRNFTPEQPLHTVTGMQRISSTDDDGRVEKVYNLVVADCHTYFVGKTMILSHDVTTPRLTNVKVPGLAAE